MKRKYFTRADENRWCFHGTVYDDERGFHDVRLVRARDTHIRRRVKIQGNANPNDPAWELYFEARLAAQMASTLTSRGRVRYLWMQKRGNAWYVVSRWRWRENGTSIICAGLPTAATIRSATKNCCTPTVTGRFTARSWSWRRLRPARGVHKGSSRMRGNSHVRFPGEGPTATLVPYPTEGRNG